MDANLVFARWWSYPCEESLKRLALMYDLSEQVKQSDIALARSQRERRRLLGENRPAVGRRICRSE